MLRCNRIDRFHCDYVPSSIPWNPLKNPLTSVLFALISYLMFTKVLGVNLPPGILPF